MNTCRVRFLLSFLLLFFSLSQSWATRPKHPFMYVKQSDGTVLQVERWKSVDGYVNYTTLDGVRVMRDVDGTMKYAVKEGGSVRPSKMLAHDALQRGTDECEFLSRYGLNSSDIQSFSDSNKPKCSRAISSATGVTAYGQNAGGTVPSIGELLIPVIMVEYPDMHFTDTTTIDKVSRLLNESGYADEKYCQGSVKDYFKDQSGGLFVPSFEVVARVVADSSYAYYGANSSSGRTDINCTKLISEALQKAAAAGVDFSKFKHNGGDIPLVSIYHAGPGEHSSYEVGCDDYLWAHFSTRSFTVQGINVKSYFVGNELLQAYKLQDGAPVPTRANVDGMGVFVHEFGHALGLPDFYYTGSNAALAETLQTPHYWSVMDYGQYAYDGYRPMGMSAYERAMLGWLKYSELTTAGIYSLSTFDSSSDAPCAYKITSNNNGCEFYFLEYRTPSRWYPSHMGEGMLITHIDYSANAWSMNQVNNDPNRQRYQVVAADNERGNMDENGKLSWAMVRGDLWGTSDACREFTDTTTPAAVLNDGGKLSQPLYAIDFTASGDMEFVFMDATLVGIEQTPLEQPAGITSTTQIYDISGKKLSGGGVLGKGLYIIRQNGVSKKVMVK